MFVPGKREEVRKRKEDIGMITKTAKTKLRRKKKEKTYLRNHKNIIKIKHCLLPVSVISIRTSRKPHALVALGENNIKKGDKSMKIVVSAHFQLELG